MYVLGPYVGHRLIAEDLGCSAEAAFQVMLKSSDVGVVLHPEEDHDQELEDIIDDNALKAFRALRVCSPIYNVVR